MAQARIHTDGILAVQLKQYKLGVQHEAEELLRLPYCVILRIHTLLLPLQGRGVVAVVIFALAQHLEDSRRLLGLLEQQQRVVKLADAAKGLGDDRWLSEESSSRGLKGDCPGREEVDQVGGEGITGYPHFAFFFFFFSFSSLLRVPVPGNETEKMVQKQKWRLDSVSHSLSHSLSLSRFRTQEKNATTTRVFQAPRPAAVGRGVARVVMERAGGLWFISLLLARRLSHSLAGGLLPQRAATCECGESENKQRAAARRVDNCEIGQTLRASQRSDWRGGFTW